MKEKIIVVIILATASLLAITSVWQDSIIVDEVPHIGAGYSYLKTGDMRLNPEHPPLAKDLAAVPLTFLNLNQEVFQSKFWLEDLNGQWEFGRKLIFNSDNDADQIAHFAKLPMLIFFLLSAGLIYRWGKELSGKTAGLIALLLFSFSPTVIAHSRFVTTDVPALFGVLFASYFFLRYLQTPTRKNFWWSVVTFGLALLAKFSTFLLAPFFVLLALTYGYLNSPPKKKLAATGRGLWQSLVLIIAGFVLVVWPIYYLQTKNYPPERQHHDTQEILKTYGKRYLADPVVWASDKPVLRAAGQYALGLLMVTQRSAGGNTTYFLGEVTRFGWHSYFPIVYFLKETLPWWILTFTALAYLIWQLEKPSRQSFRRSLEWARHNFSQFAMLLWLLIYWVTSIQSTLNIGVRHLLPTFPFAILLVSGQVSSLMKKLESNKKQLLIFSSLIVALLSWHVAENLNVYPFYLTYFNQVAGGPEGGYRYVVDSNLDWGQDLKRFSQWVKENSLPKIEFDYFGWADPYYYLKDRYVWTSATKYQDARDFMKRNQSDGWLAVSATFLQGSQGPEDQPISPNWLWLKSYSPVTTIGHSIFIYRIK